MTPTASDTDMAQFSDMAEFEERRASDPPSDPAAGCGVEGCPHYYVLMRRVDRHRAEIEELKTMVAANGAALEKNSAVNDEILAIITKGKNFFAVVDWVGTKLVGIGTLIGMIVAAVLWLRPGGKP